MSRACSAPRSAGWCWPSSPTRPGSARSGWLVSSRLPPPEGPGLAPVAERLVAGTIIDRDRTLLATFDAQIAEADKRLAALLPRTPFAVVCSGPGWRVVRAATDGAAVGDPARWPSARQVYRASGLCPATYASAGRRYDGAISREGSVTLRRAVLSLGSGCGGWTRPPAPLPPCCGPEASHPE